MSQIKIEFPAENKELAGLMGDALIRYAGGLKPEHEAYPPENLEEHLATETRIDDGLNSEGDAIDDINGAQAGDRGGVVSADTRIDTKGVPFNEETCANAKEPFYASGPRKGQWKKRKGVDDNAYDSWYGANLPEQHANNAEAGVDTAGAFGGDTVDRGTGEVAPKDCGELMGWVSAQQAAGKINQIDITDAYDKVGIKVTDLFPPNDAETVAKHVNALFLALGGFE